MALDLGAQRSGIATRLATVSGLHVHRTVPDSIQMPPAAVLAPAQEFLNYHRAHAKGLTEATWRVIIAVGKSLTAQGQDLLDDYLSAGTGQSKSLIDALEGDKTLGGAVDDTFVALGRSYDEVRWNEAESYYGAELLVTVLVDRQ